MPSKSKSKSKSADPPQPPHVRPRVQMHLSELAGVVAFAAITLLALAGVFGPSTSRLESRSGTLELAVEHPSLLRYAMLGRIDAWVTNAGTSSLPEVRVSFDSDYVHAFSNVAFTPEAEDAYVVTLHDIRPGETRLVSVAANAERHGISSGELSFAAGDQSLRFPLRTIILP